MAVKYKTSFDKQLLQNIQNRRNNLVKSLLTPELTKSYDPSIGSLLHYAIEWGNEEIVRQLIELGSDVDGPGVGSQTPLMTAVQANMGTIVGALFEANADIHLTDDQGTSALQMVFRPDYYNVAVIGAFIRRLQQTEGSSNEDLVDKLIVESGCSLFHAACFRDSTVMEYVLTRGFDVDSRGPCQRTALHAAIQLNDLKLAKWLVDVGADVNATDSSGFNALYMSAWFGLETMMEFLLENGADPNAKTSLNSTPLYMTYAFSNAENAEHYDSCVELLFEYGAIPQYSNEDSSTLFDCALHNKSNSQVEYLMAQLAMLEKRGILVAKTLMQCHVEQHRAKLLEFEKTYELCKQLLASNVNDTITIFDLITDSEAQMQIHVRNKVLAAEIESKCKEMSKCCAYYSKIVRKRVAKAVEAVKLEEAAILVLYKLFQSNYNQCYSIGRQIVSYLSNEDLRQLCQVQ